MSESHPVSPLWDQARQQLCQIEPQLSELEPGGSLAMNLGADEWLLEITPDGRLVCQAGMAMEDVTSLLSTGTCEDLGNDELAKQAKAVLNPIVAKRRRLLLASGFEETTEMNEEYVAVTFHRAVAFDRLEDVTKLLRWCQQQFAQ